MTGYIIWDARSGNVIPAVAAGDDPADRVYAEADAERLAADLNAMVLRNTMPALAGVAVAKGPFYVRPASMRAMLEGRGMSDGPRRGDRPRGHRYES